MASKIDISNAIVRGYAYAIQLTNELADEQEKGCDDCYDASVIECLLWLTSALQDRIDRDILDADTDKLYEQLVQATSPYYADATVDPNASIPYVQIIVQGGGGTDLEAGNAINIVDEEINLGGSFTQDTTLIGEQAFGGLVGALLMQSEVNGAYRPLVNALIRAVSDIGISPIAKIATLILNGKDGVTEIGSSIGIGGSATQGGLKTEVNTVDNTISMVLRAFDEIYGERGILFQPNGGMVVQDSIRQRGLGDFADWSANKQPLDYATVMMLEDSSIDMDDFDQDDLEDDGSGGFYLPFFLGANRSILSMRIDYNDGRIRNFFPQYDYETEAIIGITDNSTQTIKVFYTQ